LIPPMALIAFTAAVGTPGAVFHSEPDPMPGAAQRSGCLPMEAVRGHSSGAGHRKLRLRPRPR
jgi:hypothetical protein